MQNWYISAMFCAESRQLVEFHENATGLHVGGRTHRLPVAKQICCGDDTGAAPSVPPPVVTYLCTKVTRPTVVVAVWSAELHSVGDPERTLCSPESIAGVSAVPGHRQLILSNLITDGKRRIFSRVPQTVSTMHLQTASHMNWLCSASLTRACLNLYLSLIHI